MQKGFSAIIVLIVVLILAGLGGAYYFGKTSVKSPVPQPQVQISQTSQPTPTSQPTSIPFIIRLLEKKIKGICDSQLEYKTNIQVQNHIEAQKAFQNYVDYMENKESNGMYLKVDRSFQGAEYIGYYNGLTYWIVSFSYSTEIGEKGNDQTYVNQNGDIVQLMDCI